MFDEEGKQDVLIIIDYQKAFKNDNSIKTIKSINRLVKEFNWDRIIQTMWFNSGDINNLYMQNLNYSDCQLNGKGCGLVKMFSGAHVIPRINMYSCATDELLNILKYNMNVYIAGWETDACVLATLFSLFDKGLNFYVVSECITSKTDEIDEAARKIIKRQFGDVIISIDNISINKKEKRKLFDLVNRQERLLKDSLVTSLLE